MSARQRFLRLEYYSQGGYLVLSDRVDQRLVDDTENGDDVLVLGLRDELGEDTNIIQHALSVRDTHRAIHEIDLTAFTGVVVT